MRPTKAEAAVRIAVLARAPVPGRAKTRLIPRLGAEGAARLQAWLIQRAVGTAHAAALGPVALWCTPDARHPAFAAHARHAHLLTQPPGDLGRRMLAACAGDPYGAPPPGMTAAPSVSATPTLVIGTDCPALSPEHLRAAAACLLAGDDAVFYPAEDGGYVLVGLRRADARVFQAIDWSTARVMSQTRQRLRSLGWRWQEPETLWDVDRPDDFERLLAWQPALASLTMPHGQAQSQQAPPAST